MLFQGVFVGEPTMWKKCIIAVALVALLFGATSQAQAQSSTANTDLTNALNDLQQAFTAISNALQNAPNDVLAQEAHFFLFYAQAFASLARDAEDSGDIERSALLALYATYFAYEGLIDAYLSYINTGRMMGDNDAFSAFYFAYLGMLFDYDHFLKHHHDDNGQGDDNGHNHGNGNGNGNGDGGDD
jgi:hypothetical protein